MIGRRAYIPPKEHISSTNDVDGVNTIFGYWGPLSYPMRRRLDLVIKALPKNKKYENILDAGYGCGIFLPELARNLTPNGKLYGVDIHDGHDIAKAALLKDENIRPEQVHLQKASLDNLPFSDGTFDLIASVSVFEHIRPELLRPCLKELKRVAKKNADIVLGFPTDCIFIRGLAWVQKQDLKENHPSTHLDIFEAIKDVGFKIKNTSQFPMFWGPLTMHYNVLVQ